MSITYKDKKSYDRKYAEAVAAAQDAAGGERAFWIIGSTLRTALVAQAILQIVYSQDDSISAFAVRELANVLCERMNDDASLAS
jgi:hypothetical protein